MYTNELASVQIYLLLHQEMDLLDFGIYAASLTRVSLISELVLGLF